MNLFISFSIIFFLHELKCFINPISIDEQLKRIKESVKNGYIEKHDRLFIIFNLIYGAWGIIGLFTPIWPLFLSLFFLSIIQSQTSKLEDSKKRLRSRRLDSLVAMMVLLVMITQQFL